jgi:drug/metabolite transporter (DMT)-like permease
MELSATQAEQHTLRGVLWMLGAVLSFAAMAVAVRELQRSMDSFEILFVRSLVMLAIVGTIALSTGTHVRTNRVRLHVFRNLLHLTGQYLWVYSIGALALATVFAIEFTIAVWVALLAATFLHERLTPGRIVQLVLGVVGVLIIVRPGTVSFHPAALVMLLGAFCYGASLASTKALSSTEAPRTVLLWMSLVQTPFTLVAALPSWVTPPAPAIPWILLIGATSYTAHYCMTSAMRLADATVVAPVDFIRLPLIAVVGALFYAEPFDPMVIVGAVVIFTGTYYSLSRERRYRTSSGSSARSAAGS